MFGDVGEQVKEIRLENPNLHKQNKINIEDFAPRDPESEPRMSTKKKKGRVHASMESDSEESEDPVAKAAAENERIKREKEEAEKKAHNSKQIQKLEENQLLNEIEGLIVIAQKEKLDSQKGSQSSRTSSRGVKKGSSKGASRKNGVMFEQKDQSK